MTYRVSETEALREALRRILLEEIDAGIEEASDPGLDPDRAVHQLRKRCKRARGLLALFRESLPERRAESRRFRDIAKGLGGARDAASALEALDSTLAGEDGRDARDAASPVRDALAARRDALVGGGAVEAGLGGCRADLERARASVGGLTLVKSGWEAVGPGLAHTYGRGRRKWKRVEREPTTEQLHRWRKHAKYHWYHMRLLQDLDPEPLRERRARTKELEGTLGHMHDLAVIEDLLGGLDVPEPARRAARDVIAARCERLHVEALALGRRLFDQPAQRWTGELAKRWPTWHRPDAEVERGG